MKEYTYSGTQASFAMHTSTGSLMLTPGIAVAVALALHEVVIKSPIVKALIETNELAVNDAPKPAKLVKSTNKSDTATNAKVDDPKLPEGDGDQLPDPDAKKPTMPQLKKQLDDLGIVYAADATREQLDALLQPKQDS